MSLLSVLNTIIRVVTMLKQQAMMIQRSQEKQELDRIEKEEQNNYYFLFSYRFDVMI